MRVRGTTIFEDLRLVRVADGLHRLRDREEPRRADDGRAAFIAAAFVRVLVVRAITVRF
jgi:hypothetical protein